MTDVSFIVITDVPPADDYRNLGVNFSVYVDPQATGGSFTDERKHVHEVFNQDPKFALYLQSPVFSFGEVLIVNSDGREIAGKQRNPSKWWGVQYETFDTLEEALERFNKLREDQS